MLKVYCFQLAFVVAFKIASGLVNSNCVKAKAYGRDVGKFFAFPCAYNFDSLPLFLYNSIKLIVSVKHGF